MKKKIIVIAEFDEGRLLPVNSELIAFGRSLQKKLDLEPPLLVIPGDQRGEQLAGAWGIDVTVMAGEGLHPYNAEAHLAALYSFISDFRPCIVLAPHTAQGSDYAPALAIRLGCSCITSVEGFYGDSADVVFQRSLFNGKLKTGVAPLTDSAVITLQPGAFPAEQPDYPAVPGKVDILSASFLPQKTCSRGLIPAPPEDFCLAEAEVIVAAGRGIGKVENLALIRELAGIFSRSAVAGSRIVCDLGWLEYSHQIGITGKTVSPGLYIACGISGSIQHVSGMKDSRCIVAVNNDPRAAIFDLVDYGVVEDLTTFIPTLMDVWEKRQQGAS